MENRRISEYDPMPTGIEDTDLFETARPSIANYKASWSFLRGELSNFFSALLHSTRHQVGGADVLNVTGLSGDLADPQTPKTHSATHGVTGPDSINVTGLSGELADPQPPKTHNNTAHSETYITDTVEHGNDKHNPYFSQIGLATGQINSLTEKTTPVADDILIIEDSAASMAGKKMKYSQLASALVGGIPGEIRMYGGASAPTGWLLCDGQAISRTTYSDLYAVVGTKYGVGDGLTTFNIPNLKGRVPVGLDANITDFNDRGKSGGEKTHQLTVSEMPSHRHQKNNPTTSGSGSNYLAVAGQSGLSSSDDGAPFLTNTGGDTAHENMPPYVIVNYIIKT